MKRISWIIVLLALIIGFLLLDNYTYVEQESMNTQNSHAQIIPISHATAVILWDDTVFYTDPVGGEKAFDSQPPADIVLVTDIHGDHFSVPTLLSVVGMETTLVVPQAVKDLLPENLASRASVLGNGETLESGGFSVLSIPMYNLPESDDSKHTKGRGNGYVVEREGARVYIAGDTAGIPEMRSLKNIDTALVPMNLPYTMGIEEAASAVLEFKPRSVYPYHYRGTDGFADVEKFKSLVNDGNKDIEVILLDWYPR